jgi:hypothetical protein
MKKLALVLVITIVLTAVPILFLTLPNLGIQENACQQENVYQQENACIFCIWDEIIKLAHGYDRLMAFWFFCPFIPIGFIATAQNQAYIGIDYILGAISSIYQSGYAAGYYAGSGS